MQHRECGSFSGGGNRGDTRPSAPLASTLLSGEKLQLFWAFCPRGKVLETSDVITLHAPLMPRTRNLLAMPKFQRVGRRPLLINASRGGLLKRPTWSGRSMRV